MSKTAVPSSPQEAQYKAQADHYLSETKKILRSLAAERQRAARRPLRQISLLEQVKEILHGK